MAGTPGVDPAEGNVAVFDTTGGDTLLAGGALVELELLLFHHELLLTVGPDEPSLDDLQPAMANRLSVTAAMRAVEVRMAGNPGFCREVAATASIGRHAVFPDNECFEKGRYSTRRTAPITKTHSRRFGEFTLGECSRVWSKDFFGRYRPQTTYNLKCLRNPSDWKPKSGLGRDYRSLRCPVNARMRAAIASKTTKR